MQNKGLHVQIITRLQLEELANKSSNILVSLLYSCRYFILAIYPIYHSPFVFNPITLLGGDVRLISYNINRSIV